MLMMQRVLITVYFKRPKPLLPVHSDVWSGDHSFEINLWLPLVDC